MRSKTVSESRAALTQDLVLRRITWNPYHIFHSLPTTTPYEIQLGTLGKRGIPIIRRLGKMLLKGRVLGALDWSSAYKKMLLRLFAYHEASYFMSLVEKGVKGDEETSCK